MKKTYYELLVNKAQRYIEESNKEIVNTALSDALGYINKLTTRLSKDNAIKENYNKNYIKIAVYWYFVGMIISTSKPEFKGVEELWKFTKNLPINQKEIIDIANIVISIKSTDLNKSVEGFIYQDVINLSKIGKNTWVLLLTKREECGKIIKTIPEYSAFNFEQSKAIFEKDLHWLLTNIVNEYIQLKWGDNSEN